MEVKGNKTDSDALPSEGTRNDSPPSLSEEDFYYEGEYLVFTAAYHLKRGYCCHSDCRHCPYC
jgi:Family of unknown function (DUF5522)